MDQLRVGFIGAGRISDLHALEYMSNDRAQIVAVCDLDLDIARERGAKWGVPEDRIFSDYADLLALEDVDLVEILLPHHLHRSATLDAAAAGKHISLQKPMALSVAEADEMIAAADEADVILRSTKTSSFIRPCNEQRP